MPRSGSLAALSRLPAPAPPRSTREPVPSAAPHPSHGAGRPGRPRPRPPRFAKPGRQNRPAPPSAGRCPRCPRRADMVLDSLSAEGERCCRQLLRETTARFRARPAAAAVLVPLCLVRGVPALLYTLRSSRLAGRHKGDVSFPGGKCDPADQDVVHTALRETQEELGLAVPKEHVWGVMRPVYDRAKASVVPVLASVGQLDLQSLKPNPEEVEEVFVLPLAHLLQTQNQGYTHFCHRGHFSYTLPVFLHGPHRVWGLTAVITEFALQLLAPDTYRSHLVCVQLPNDSKPALED
ncbi:mitochondrial coenzyme A diphosphatase NUDT8 isoform X4 [Cavia porcellus]|uniref:mitochondrial coenzyme A diphosphatase NUDT8 isoform X4 n=1 Tax=Cavia porcellus TaxID=10141 RepID=UPI000661DC24|nr:nucleoside diphosphate-linked moiety X motif 8 [Cavia porcellus]